MKKIGILTFHNTTNYGAIFQCYALQKYINDNYSLCEVINYNNKFLTKNYSINPFSASSLRDFVKKIVYYIPEFRNKRYFKEFSREHINITKDTYNEKNIFQLNNSFDKFIVGSDQVWNYSLSGNDSNYFLEFCSDDKKKNSYAASFGSSVLPSEHRDEIIRLLNKQNSISIREDEIIKSIKQVVEDKKIIQSIDPVFLLSKHEWSKLIDKYSAKNIKEKYIFVYEVARTPLLRNFVHQLKKKYGMKVIYLSKAGKKIKNVTKLYSVSPLEFLRYIKNAEYVVTSSFHGMAFSLIFEKNFYYDVNDSQNEFGSRLNSLSRLCNVNSRRINKNFDDNDFNNIDYKEINDKLKVEIENSYKYLNDILSD